MVYIKQYNIYNPNNFQTALVSSTLKAVEVMGKDKGGRGGAVINIASIAAVISLPNLAIYHATKSAVLQFSRCLGVSKIFRIRSMNYEVKINFILAYDDITADALVKEILSNLRRCVNPFFC